MNRANTAKPQPRSKSKSIGLLILTGALIAGAILGANHFRLGYWMAPPKEKFLRSWTEDVRLLEQSGKLPKEWADIKSVEIKSDNSTVVREWLVNLNSPIKSNPKGRYKLESYLIHQIDGYRYAVLVEYTLTDLVTNNTVAQFGRTLKLGLVY